MKGLLYIIDMIYRDVKPQVMRIIRSCFQLLMKKHQEITRIVVFNKFYKREIDFSQNIRFGY
jgi:spore coat protein CotF